MALIQADLSDDFTNAGTVSNNGTTQINAKGNLNNTGEMKNSVLQFNAKNLDNTGDMEASEMVYGKVSGNVKNTGIINTGDQNNAGITYINAKGKIDNTGKIYGGLTAIGGETINNHKDGDKAGIIAAREHLALGAKEIYNTGDGADKFADGKLILGNDTSSLISLGTASIGKSLDDNANVIGQADYLENNGALIDIAGDTEWNVKKTLNKNHKLEIERAVNQHDDKRVTRYSPYGSGEWFVSDKDGYWYQTANHAKGEFVFYADENGNKRSPVREDTWTEEHYTETTYRDELRHSEPAKISIGGNLKINGDKFTVENSKVLIGGAWIGSDKNKTLDLQNNESVLEEFKRQNGSWKQTTTDKHHWKWRRIDTASGSIVNRDTPKTVVQTETNDIVGYDENAKITANGFAKPIATNGGVSGFSITIPNGNGLFKLTQLSNNPNKPLIETDPRFTNYRDWLAGNYMLDRLQPDNLMKRIGDGYYEQRLINEQVAQLTGYRYLGGYTDDEEQFKALMDNGIAVADDLQLTVGVKLTKEQANKLTQDIVWYEKRTVTLPDGSSQEV
ncbi:MAG: S-layer family protein, partial [Neisseriaceae bacterium]|nr:S-layer family protein [Neisseriaceae bacterium]